MAVFLDEDGYVDQRVCRFYLASKCLSGNNCSFLHCKELLKTKMTWICLHYLGSSGCYGANCRFDHPSWANGLHLLPKICGQYRHENDGKQCSDKDCKYLHFTDEEHQAYIKDQIIPERYSYFQNRNESRLVQYSSDEDEQSKVDPRSRDKSSRNHYRDSKQDRSQSPKRIRNKSPKRERSRSPVRSSSHTKREESPKGDERRIQKMKHTIKDLRVELDDLWKDKKHLQRELADHKRFHDSDQELINDLMRAREKLEEDVSRLNNEKLELSKQISDLFSDNKVVVEENQRLRGVLQQVQDTQPRVQAAPQTIAPMPHSNYPDLFSSSNNPSTMYQTSWN